MANSQNDVEIIRSVCFFLLSKYVLNLRFFLVKNSALTTAISCLRFSCQNLNAFFFSLLAAVFCLMLALTFFTKNSPSLHSEISFTGSPPS